MRKLCVAVLAAALLQSASLSYADSFSFSINVGGPPVVITQPPDFLYPPELGFGVAVGVPYDLFYISGVYYVYRGGGWYRTSDYYGGNWVRVRHRGLPYELRRYRLARIHEFRDRDYRVYREDREHYRGRHFRPDGRGEHREMRGPGGGERHEMRGPQGRGDMRGQGHGEGRGEGRRDHDDRR